MLMSSANMGVTPATEGLAVANEHAVHFYEHEHELAVAVASYVGAAIAAGDAALVIATQAHRRLFVAELEARAIDTARACREGFLVCLDAAEMLEAFVDEQGVDGEAFNRVIGGIVRRTAGQSRDVRAYGEMVALLWDAGRVLAAIQLESLWNDLARELRFSLLCSYASGSVSSSERRHALQQVCKLHSSVLGGVPATTPARTPMSTDEIAATFVADVNAPARARTVVAGGLWERGYDDALVRDAALVVSELAANAVRHANSPFSVVVRPHGEAIRVVVEDARGTGGVQGEPIEPRPMHGLGLVETVAARWGIEATAGGKAVWAELSLVR
jgi:anti-sigma regulatory factor (Ser/Thr protein kinase)